MTSPTPPSTGAAPAPAPTAAPATKSGPSISFTGFVIAFIAILALIVGVIAWHYKSARDKAETNLTQQGKRIAVLEAQLDRAVKGGTMWSKVIYKGVPDSIPIALGDSIEFQRQDSIPLRIYSATKTAEYPLDMKSVPRLPSTSWIKLEIDPKAPSDSLRVKYRTWRARWS